MIPNKIRNVLDDFAERHELSDEAKKELLHTVDQSADDIVAISGRGIAEAVETVEHASTCDRTEWMTGHKAQRLETDDWNHLDEDEAECVNCGATSTVTDRSVEENVIVDKAGAETITDYIAGGAPSDFVRMKIGSTTSPTAPAEGDTQLSNTVSTSPSLTPTQQSTGGAQKKVVWSHTFSSSTGRSSVVSMGMDTGTATGTQASLLNRVTFTAKDNANNDLALTYELTVS